MGSPNSGRGGRVALVGLIVLLVAAGGLSYLALQPSKTASASTALRTSLVQQGSLQTTVGATGNVQAASAWNVGFESMGKVTSVLLKVGDAVAVGTPLATQDPTGAQTTLREARAALATAQAKLAGAQAAAGTAGTVTIPASATAAAAAAAVTTATNAANAAADAVRSDTDSVNTASDKVNQAQAAFDATTLRSPVAGTVTNVNGVVGQQVSGTGLSSATPAVSSSSSGGTAASGTGSSAGGSSLFTIADLSTLQVKATVAEADSTKVKVGQPAALAFDALPDVKVAGKVASVALTATVASNVVSYDTVVNLVNPPATVRNGMTTTVTITTASRDGVLRVPTAAVRGSGQASSVSVLNADGTQVTKRIVVGMRGDDAVEVVSGLVAGDKVVVSSGLPTTATTTNRNAANRAGGPGGVPVGGGGLGGPGGFGGGGGGGGGRGG